MFLGYIDSMDHRRPPFGDYINQKLSEQQVPSYANDTLLHYQSEGEISIVSHLSSIDSSSLHDENDYRFLYSLGPEFSRLADSYGGDDS
jgi:hypothetical protein